VARQRPPRPVTFMERTHRGDVGPEIGGPFCHSNTQQGECREQSPRRRIGHQLAEERLGVDRAVHDRGQLLRIQEQQAVLLKVR